MDDKAGTGIVPDPLVLRRLQAALNRVEALVRGPEEFGVVLSKLFCMQVVDLLKFCEDDDLEEKLLDILGATTDRDNQAVERAACQAKEQLAMFEDYMRKNFTLDPETQAFDVLWSFSIFNVDGNVLEPIQVPSTPTLSDASNVPLLAAFDVRKYGNDEDATQQFMQHHQQCLASFGVRFDSAGEYECQRAEEPYRIESRMREYYGSVDVLVLPYGGSTAQSRVAFKHIRHDQRQNEQTQQGDHEVQTGASADECRRPLSAEEKGHAVLTALAVLRSVQYPPLFDMTDGSVHHLLQFNGSTLVIWENLSPQQAYYKIARQLLDKHKLLTRLDLCTEELQGNERTPLVKLHSKMPLEVQLRRLLPDIEDEDRFTVAWRVAQRRGVPVTVLLDGAA